LAIATPPVSEPLRAKIWREKLKKRYRSREKSLLLPDFRFTKSDYLRYNGNNLTSPLLVNGYRPSVAYPLPCTGHCPVRDLLGYELL